MSDTTTGLTNRAIAERIGYSVTYHEARGYWRLNAPDGGYAETTGEAKAWGLVPDYLDSTDAALTLPLAEGDTIELTVLWDGTAAVRIVRSITGAMGEWHDADSAAQAVCAAWWAWMEAQEG